MKPSVKIPGISVSMEELIGVRSLISEQQLRRIQRRSSNHSGAREARIRGRGMEYEETRAYVSGDDVRTMDWRVMARTGEAHTKIFSEERERRFLLAVDLSPGMYFGTRYAFKSRAASLAAAHLGWLANLSGARTGGVIVTPSRQIEVKPDKTRSGLMAVFHHLENASQISLPPSDTASRLNILLKELKRVAPAGSIISLISDFLAINEVTVELISGICRHCDLNLFWVHDQTETEPWLDGYYPVLAGDSSFDIEVSSRHSENLPQKLQLHHKSKIDSLVTGLNRPIYSISANHEVSAQIRQQFQT